MKQLFLIMTIFTASLALSGNAFAASAELTLKDYKSFYDVREGNYTRSGFQELIQSHFTEHFSELANQLPENFILKIVVTDIDLAGDVRVASMNGLRIYKNNYPPRMNFTYQLLDDKGKEIKSNEVIVKELGYMSTRAPLKYRNKLFGYEKNMLDDWFKSEFSDLITK